MRLKILPNQVDLELAIDEFGFKEMPTLRALRLLLRCSLPDGLRLYFDNTIRGIDSTVAIGNIFDENKDLIDFVQAEPEQIVQLSGRKIVERAHVYKSSEQNKFFISVSMMSQNGTSYFIPDTEGIEHADVPIDSESFYFDRKELLTYLKDMDRDNIIKDKPKPKTTTDDYSRSEFKALALLARDKATTANFQVGDKVNAAAIRKHIESLAINYSVPTTGLASLDDKINKALTKHDLKDIRPPAETKTPNQES
ncbi:MAG: hypothetical protein KUG82_11520 [Pseudomonadales bacterium]|nr:hypothetical protein [Pseudomonadales bacterium]